ncbi:MAG: hypothetical protein N0E48_16070 [Candidatus Thiodiazotropha endolucinida]|nr:hypothetical protein [Candidatus Thiodiazotropha taylori]MCW4344848.1 hypothetical protein [Candidatus Thiodiazotropha endolucinida]
MHFKFVTFNGGKISPLLQSRVDLNTFKNACLNLENFIPLPQGPVIRRCGTRFIAETKYANKAVRLLEFEFNDAERYALEFGDYYVRFYTQGERLAVNDVPFELVSPYSEFQLAQLNIVQSLDVLYICHPEHPPYKLSRYGLLDWDLTVIDWEWEAFDDINSDPDVKLTVSDTTGAINVTASKPFFKPEMEGSQLQFTEIIASNHPPWKPEHSYSQGDSCYYNGNVYFADVSGRTGTLPPSHKDRRADGGVTWRYLHSGNGVCRITSYVTDHVAACQVLNTLPDSAKQTGGTDLWSRSEWNLQRGYPSTICFHDDRLWLGGTFYHPQTVWGSRVGEYENFRMGSNDSDAVAYTINARTVNRITALVSNKLLFIGTSGGEFVVTGHQIDDAITPTNVRITPRTNHGCAGIQSVTVGSDIVFVQSSKDRLREFEYDFQSDSHRARDLNILAEGILQGKITQIAYSSSPHQIVWVCTDLGEWAGLTREKIHDIAAWHVHELGGRNASVVSLAVATGIDNAQSLYLAVNRDIGASQRTYIEHMDLSFKSENGIYIDCASSHKGKTVTQLDNLDYLNGETVKIYTQPGTVDDLSLRTVKNGKITMPYSFESAQVGLPYLSILETVPISAGVTAAEISAIDKISPGNIYFEHVNSKGTLSAYLTSSQLSMSRLAPNYARSNIDSTNGGSRITQSGILKLSGMGLSLVVTHGSPLPLTLTGIYGYVTKH